MKTSSAIPVVVEKSSSMSHQNRVVVLNNEPPIDHHTRPFKMNTYIQLEIDQSSFNSLPRICKFLVTRLQIESDASSSPMNSVILAVKLQVSKRSLRTLEIPVRQCDEPDHSWSHVDLDLNYNITYPHHLKKDTNLLYFYVQKRKKYKTKKIMGYKTLAYAVVDLATVLQRPLSSDIPLYLASTKNSGQTTARGGSSADASILHHHNSSTGSRQVVGYLTVQSLVSLPADLNDENVIVPQSSVTFAPLLLPPVASSMMHSSQVMSNLK
jgi:hypothetical protein